MTKPEPAASSSNLFALFPFPGGRKPNMGMGKRPAGLSNLDQSSPRPLSTRIDPSIFWLLGNGGGGGGPIRNHNGRGRAGPYGQSLTSGHSLGLKLDHSPSLSLISRRRPRRHATTTAAAAAVANAAAATQELDRHEIRRSRSRPGHVNNQKR